MARNPRQAALYEVINRNRFRDAQLKALERIGAKPKFTSKPKVEPAPHDQSNAQVVEQPKVVEEPKQVEPVKVEPVKVEVVVEKPQPVVQAVVAEPVITEPPKKAEPVIAEPAKLETISLQPEKVEKSEAVAVEIVKEPEKPKAVEKPAKKEMVWSNRPKPFRVFPDRIELCFSWPVAGISVLAVAAVCLVFFRLGQMKSSPNPKPVETVKPAVAVIKTEDIKPKAPVIVPAAPKQEQETPKLVEPMGENAIVIANCDSQADLEPVQKYFGQFGIATEITRPNNASKFMLVTQNRYDNIEKSGSEGNLMKKKIMSVGAGYRPGPGAKSFGQRPFQDVYGQKIRKEN